MRHLPSRRRARWPMLAIATIAALVGLAGPMSLAAAVAPTNTWGPQQLPYLNGVICDTDAGSTAMVAWPSAATAAPTFALASVDAPTGGVVGVPATAATVSVPATAANTAQPADRLAALAFLIERYGNAKQAAVVGDVAALVANDATSAACLAQRGGALDPATAAAMWHDAIQWAGPYKVEVTPSAHRLILDTPTTVTARVLSATGVGVPGLSVTFSSNDPTATMTRTTAVTDATGSASTALKLPANSASTQVSVTASTAASTGLIEMTDPGTVPLVGAAPLQESNATVNLPVDVTADPTVATGVSRALVLAGSTVQTKIVITGMNGHAGSASVSALGPLPFVAGSGCASYPAAKWDGVSADAAHVTSVASAVPISGDGSYPAAPLVLSSAGCYQLRATVVTANAQPNVTASSTDASAKVITVPPVTVSETTAGHGVATAGPLSTEVHLTGTAAALLDDVAGTVRGPREPPQTGCPTTGWDRAPVIGTLTAAAGAPARSVTLTTAPLTRGDCYAFSVTANIVLSGVGTIPVSIAPSGITSMLVVTPIVFANSVSTSSVHPGEHLHASVTVYETLAVPGHLRLQLARQPYTDSGCFGLDWSAADVVPLAKDAPATATTGDGTYDVESPAVPGPGCWTVEPVLTLDGNTTARVVGAPDQMSMVAFTSITPVAPLRHSGAATKLPDDARRVVVAAALTLSFMLCAVVLTLIIARRMSRNAVV